MAFGRVRLKGTGKAGHGTSRWLARADAKFYAKRKRRAEERKIKREQREP